MVFAFLPTAVLMVVSLILIFAGGLVAAIEPYSMWLLSAVMIAIGAACVMISIKASGRLYKNSMLMCSENFDKWYTAQRKIAVSSFGGYKISVLLNTIYGMCIHERFEKSSMILAETKPLVQASGNAYYKYCYLMQLISVKEKTGDNAYISDLFSEAFQNLELAKIPKSDKKSAHILRYKCSRLEYEFYRSDPQKLNSELRILTKQFNEAAKECVSLIDGLAGDIGYEMLAYSCNIAVSDLMLDKKDEAEMILRNIASCKCDFPLVNRARKYILTKDILVLFSAVP